MPSVSMAPWQYAAAINPFDHFAFYGGVATGKTFTGSHFALNQIVHNPEMTGGIFANTYDQLSQATLREFIYWLDQYEFEFVIDCKPPNAWSARRSLKSYANTIHVRNPFTDKVTMIFTRVLSNPDAFRGIEMSWYWMDETRDAPEVAHDVVLSRMRETPDYVKGIITTTTNGEDWSYKRFCRTVAGSGRTYGSMHVPTRVSLEHGIITEKYYETMLKSYSPMMALQELEAQHVNILGGKAYYAASDQNRRALAPWGDEFPNPERQLIVGCDFNFAPAPCVWMIGQQGPALFGPNGQNWERSVHWFGEVSGVEMSTVMMSQKLLMQYPGFFYKFYGDVSGGVGTTSNAGVTDYDQIAATMSDAEVGYSIDYFQADADEAKSNPRVRTRVENMNALLKNAVGEIRMTYSPQSCPHFDGDMKMVGWKETTHAGRGKLDDGGDKQRTHASDAAGYAMMKIFPPGRRGRIIPSIQSTLRLEFGLIDQRRERGW